MDFFLIFTNLSKKSKKSKNKKTLTISEECQSGLLFSIANWKGHTRPRRFESYFFHKKLKIDMNLFEEILASTVAHSLLYLSICLIPIIIPVGDRIINESIPFIIDHLVNEAYEFLYPPIIEPEIVEPEVEIIDADPVVIDDFEGRTEIDDQENPVSTHWYSLGSYLGEVLTYRLAYNLPLRYLPRNLPRNRPIPIVFTKAEIIAWLMLAANTATRIYFLTV